MARKSARRGGGRPGSIVSSLKGLVESVAERVLTRVQKDLPGRDQLRALERQVRGLARRVDSRIGRVGVRRVGRPRLNRKCKVAGCGLPHVAQGYCSKHYQAWRRRNMKRSRRVGARAGR